MDGYYLFSIALLSMGYGELVEGWRTMLKTQASTSYNRLQRRFSPKILARRFEASASMIWRVASSTRYRWGKGTFKQTQQEAQALLTDWQAHSFIHSFIRGGE